MSDHSDDGDLGGDTSPKNAPEASASAILPPAEEPETTPPPPTADDVSAETTEQQQQPTTETATVDAPTATKASHPSLTAEELKIIRDPELFAEYCLSSNKEMLAAVAEVRKEQKSQKTREGELAAHMALLALDVATIHDQFKHKTISRAVAEKLNELALEAGVSPIDIEKFAIEKGGPEGAIIAAPASTPKEAVHDNESEKRTVQKRKQGPDGGGGKRFKTSADKKQDPKATTEDATVVDEGGIILPGGFISRENEVIIAKWGFRGTGIKGKAGCILRIVEKHAVPSTVIKAAKAAAADVASVSDRTGHPKLFGSTLYKFVEVVLDNVLANKTEHAPFRFENLVELTALELSNPTPRDLNDAQPLLWSELLRLAYVSMGMTTTERSIALQGLDAAIQMLQKKVEVLGKGKSRKKSAPSTSTQKDNDDESGEDF